MQHDSKQATPPALPSANGSAPRRFYWKQAYELDDKVHWALHDTQTDSEAPPARVTCGTMILECHSPNYFGRPLDGEYWPKLIAELLNAHFAKAQNTKLNGSGENQ